MKPCNPSLRDGIPVHFPVKIASILGPEEDRYFSSGYKEVKYEICEVLFSNSGSYFATYKVIYPSDWSIGRNGKVRDAHLSTIDAAAIVLELLKSYGLDYSNNLMSISLRAGSFPWVELSEVPVNFRIRLIPEKTHCLAVYEINGTVGNISVRCCLKDIEGLFETTIKTDLYSFYSDSSKVVLDSEITSYNSLTQTLTSIHASRTNKESEQVMSSVARSSTGLHKMKVELLTIMGQLAQSVILLSANKDRDALGTLWMRSVNLVIPEDAISAPVHFGITTQLVRDRLVGRGMGGLRDVVVSCESSFGTRAEAKLAYNTDIEA